MTVPFAPDRPLWAGVGVARRRALVTEGAPIVLGTGIVPPGTVQLPPDVVPPANAINFNLAVNQAIVGVGQVTTPAGLVQVLPFSLVGVVNVVELLLNGITATSNVQWELLINGAPVPGYTKLTILGRDGAAAVGSTLGPGLRLAIPAGGTMSVQITNVDGAAYTAGTTLRGWMWPSQR